MMMGAFGCRSLLLFLPLVSLSCAVQPVKVAVYYEALCPDSQDFITDQLWLAYQKVPQIFTVDWIPFGKANYTGGTHSWNFTCQHGPRECYGNKIQSCALFLYSKLAPQKATSFIHCVMAASDPVDASEQCALDNQMNWKKIAHCSNSTFGDRRLYMNGKKTKSLKPPLTMVPWIVIDDVYSEKNEMLALSDFLQLVCTNYKGDPPAACIQIYVQMMGPYVVVQ